MTKQRIIYFTALIISFALFVRWEDYIVHLLFYFILLLPLFSLAATIPLCFLLECKLIANSSTAAKNKPFSFIIHFNNHYFFPVARINAMFICSNTLETENNAVKKKINTCAGYMTESEMPVDVSFNFCGRVTATLKKIRICDFLGIFSLPVIHKNNTTIDIYVIPDYHEIVFETKTGVQTETESTVYSTKKSGNDPGEIFKLRDYMAGDRPHAIHWKLSNRLDRLIVREYGLPINVSVTLLIDISKNSGILNADRIIEAFYSIASFLTEQEMMFTVRFVNQSGIFEEYSVSNEYELADALHGILSFKSSDDEMEGLKAFLSGSVQSGGHLIYLVSSEKGSAICDLLAKTSTSGIFRRISVIAAGMSDDFYNLNDSCEFYDLKNGVINSGLETMKL